MHTNRTVRSLTAAVALLLGAHTATAHDLWLIPPDRAEPGKPVRIRANVGDEFPRSDVAHDTATYVRRFVVAPDKTTGKLLPDGKEGTSGLMRFLPEKPGVYVVAVETQPKLITLAAEKFNEYLVAAGLQHIYLLRAREKTLDQPGRERYRKSVTALLRVGRGSAGDPCHAVGLPLEIVPLRNPLELKAGDTLPVRVLFQSKPLADANLGWDHPGDGVMPSGTVRTNPKGEARIPIAQAGLMTIRLTHMTRPKAADYEWESFWTTLTFELPE